MSGSRVRWAAIGAADVYTKPEVDALTGGPLVTALNYSTGTESPEAPDSDYYQVKTFGQFTKSAADSFVRVTWTSHVESLSAGFHCRYQLRIGDRTSTGTTNTGSFFSTGFEAITQSTEATPVTVVELFRFLDAGTYDVDLYLSNDSTDCFENPGNFRRAVQLEEIRGS